MLYEFLLKSLVLSIGEETRGEMLRYRKSHINNKI